MKSLTDGNTNQHNMNNNDALSQEISDFISKRVGKTSKHNSSSRKKSGSRTKSMKQENHTQSPQVPVNEKITKKSNKKVWFQRILKKINIFPSLKYVYINFNEESLMFDY